MRKLTSGSFKRSATSPDKLCLTTLSPGETGTTLTMDTGRRRHAIASRRSAQRRFSARVFLVEIRAAQIEAAFLANHLAAVSMQLGGAVRADRGRIILQIRWSGIRRSEIRGNASPDLNYSRRSLGIGRTHDPMGGQTPGRPQCRCC